MEARNSSGRIISLLNDSSEKKIQPPPFLAHSHSRAASSCASNASTPGSPPQLYLSRADSQTFSSPSPLTPSPHYFDNVYHTHHQYYIPNQSYKKMDDTTGSMYPPLPDAPAGLPQAYTMPPMTQQLPPQPGQPIYRSSTSPASEPSRVSTVSATSNSKSNPKKNQYPCPMAKQYGCTDFFTTSGHAARHAKKHTGKKDAFCPECNKAFTRKDNMEQHRRTHQNGRGTARSNNGDESKVKKAAKPVPKKGIVKAEPQQFEAAVQQELADQSMPVQAPLPQIMQVAQVQALQQQQAVEQAMMMQPGNPYFVNPVDSGPIPALPNAMPDLNMRPPLQRANFTTSLDYVPPVMMPSDPESLHYSYPSPGLSNNLSSLALAASKHRRLSEEKSQSQSPSQETPSEETP